MRDESDHFGSPDFRFCGDCKHYEPRYTHLVAEPGVIIKKKQDRGDCARYGIVVGERSVDEEGCFEE